MTNAEWLRSLSDDELAEFLCYLTYGRDGNCEDCIAGRLCKRGCNGMAAWLQEEYIED